METDSGEVFWSGITAWTGGRLDLMTMDNVRLFPVPQGRGDDNGNGLVEQGDLDLVLAHWGSDASPPPVGWINDLPMGSIDQAELDGVLLNWGSTEVGAAAVPEPCGIVLLL